jgi:hypothetical protein
MSRGDAVIRTRVVIAERLTTRRVVSIDRNVATMLVECDDDFRADAEAVL